MTEQNRSDPLWKQFADILTYGVTLEEALDHMRYSSDESIKKEMFHHEPRVGIFCPFRNEEIEKIEDQWNEGFKQKVIEELEDKARYNQDYKCKYCKSHKLEAVYTQVSSGPVIIIDERQVEYEETATEPIDLEYIFCENCQSELDPEEVIRND